MVEVVTPVSTLRAETVAAPTLAPVGSVTVPDTVPAVVCASAADPSAMIPSKTRTRRLLPMDASLKSGSGREPVGASLCLSAEVVNRYSCKHRRDHPLTNHPPGFLITEWACLLSWTAPTQPSKSAPSSGSRNGPFRSSELESQR